MTSQHLLSLADRVEQAAGPSYTLDCEIWDAIYPGERDDRFRKLTESGPYKGRLGPADKDGYIKPLRSFTASIDAAMSLVPEGMTWRVGLYVAGRQYGAFVGDHIAAYAATPAAALCAASLRAIAGGAE